MAGGMRKRDQYTLSAKTCNRGILQIDVSRASVFGRLQSSSLSRSGGGRSESCLQSTAPGRKVVPAALYTLFVLLSEKALDTDLSYGPFHLSYHLHISRVEQFRL